MKTGAVPLRTGLPADSVGNAPCAPVTMAKATGNTRIGISGWRYEPWRGVFAQRHELAFASRALPSIEINGTFYSL